MTTSVRATRSRPQTLRTAGREFRAALQALDAAQKSGSGVPAYTRWVNRRAARGVVAAAAVLRFSPNQVTLISAALSTAALAALLLMDLGPLTGLLAATLLALGYVLDSADGQLARLQGSGGVAGEWLDHVVDAIRTPAIHLTVLVVVLTRVELPDAFAAAPILFCLLAVGHFMSQILAEKLMGRRQLSSSEHGPGRSFLLLPADMGMLCWVFVLWGAPILFLTAYSLLMVANGAVMAVSVRRKFSQLTAQQSETRLQ